MASSALNTFSPQVQEWFRQAFEEPTRVQELAWPAIASGDHVLIAAPTGSGKTLAAFLWGIDRLMTSPPTARGQKDQFQHLLKSETISEPSLEFHSSRQTIVNAPQSKTRLVYVSPLKALSYDVEKNLRVPLSGISALQRRDFPPERRAKLGDNNQHRADPFSASCAKPGIPAELRPVRVGVRTGDTPQNERREMLRNPPEILITTPESLYLMLTSQARSIFSETEWLIVDEIHALAHSKRGAHLALTLERLCEQAQRDVQRIGLSATQRPLDEVGKFLVGPKRKCTLVDAGTRKALDLKICVPVESMVEPDLTTNSSGENISDLDPFTGQEPTRRSIWPAMYPQLLDLVEQHNSTLIFVNNRRSAERLALRLNELSAKRAEAKAEIDGGLNSKEAQSGGKQPSQASTGRDRSTHDLRPELMSRIDPDRNGLSEVARAHHGSLAREQRTLIEDQLKAGELPCLIATSSLELGIDMGAIDLVIQVESPKSVTRGMQRVGRSGHNVNEIAKGRIFPKFRADLLEAAVVTKRMRDGLIEETVIPHHPLDVLAQQIVAIAASNEDGVSVDGLETLIKRTYSFDGLSRTQLENVLDMLDGRYPSEQFAELRPRIIWDRIAGTIRARRGARQLAIVNAGTIPDRGLFTVNLPDGRRVGELDEEMVYEARPGQVFLLGASSWRIEEITRDRVIVSPAPGVPGAVPFWKGEGLGRPKELGEAIGKFSRWAVSQRTETLMSEYDLDEFAAKNLLEYLQEQENATRVVPSDETIVIERFRDEIGDWRLCVLSPFGGRVHAALGLAVTAKIRSEFNLEADAIWSDDGIIVHLPDADEPPGAELVLVDPSEVEDLIVAELGGSALFGARFRENAARALLLPRSYPGKRTPLWQQRLKAQSLLEVAHRYPEFPIILETYRECLRDVLDVPGLIDLLQRIHIRELNVVEVETETASPFAGSLLFDYIATYMYEGDTPNAERRAAALALDRDLLRELLGQEELRELIDPTALAEVEADLQCLSDRTQAQNIDSLHDILRRLGDLTISEIGERLVSTDSAQEWTSELKSQRRAVSIRINGEHRWIAAEDAGLYRDALGAVPPSGLPEAFVEEVPDSLLRVTRRYARTHGPFENSDLLTRYGFDFSSTLTALEREGELIRGELRPGGNAREWCNPEILRRIRRSSLAVLRREIEPADQRAFARFATNWQGIDRYTSSGAGIDRLREVLVPLQGLPLPLELWERDVLPRRVGAYSPSWIDQLCAAGEILWIGAGAIGRRSGKVALYFRSDIAALGPPTGSRPFPVPSNNSRSIGEIKSIGPTAEDKHTGGQDESFDEKRPTVQSNGNLSDQVSEQSQREIHQRIRARLRDGACFFTDLLSDIPEFHADDLTQALWDLAWAGEITNDAFAPLRSSGARTKKPTQQRRPYSRRRFGTRRGTGHGITQGRWSLTAPLFGENTDPIAKRRALAELLLERYGIVTREQVLAEGIPGGFSGLYDQFSALETLGVARRGYFVEGLGGSQFALPGAVERLRSQKEPTGKPLLLAANDPAQLYGSTLRWPQLPRLSEQDVGITPNEEHKKLTLGKGRLSRRAGAYLVTIDGIPILFLERGGKGLLLMTDDHTKLRSGIATLVDAVKTRHLNRIGIEQINGLPATQSSLFPLLIELGFNQGPTKLTLDS